MVSLPSVPGRRFLRGFVLFASTASAVLGCSSPSSSPGDQPAGAGGSVGAGGAVNGGGGAAGASGGNAGAAAAGGSATSAGGVSSAGGASPATGGTVAGGTGGTGASGSGGAGGGGPIAARRLEGGPTYPGSVNNGADCSKTYATTGFEPDGAPGERHPLFLYFTGTNFILSEAAFRQEASLAALAVTEVMARRGFVALWVEYDNSGAAWLSDHGNQLRCMFGASGASAPGGVLAAACALPQVDCDQGIATWGHSLGAYVAHMAGNVEPRVRAAWLAGYGGDAVATLSKNRLRVVNGESDTTNGTVPVLNPIAGFSLAECPDDGRSECLRPDGSGWIIVRKVDCQVSGADHCWFDKTSCLASTPTLEPNWVDPGSTKAFALESNADWVAATARRP